MTQMLTDFNLECPA